MPGKIVETLPCLPAFASTYDTYFKFVWSSARYLGVDPNDLDDVVQEVFIVVYERLSSLEHPELLRSWIYGIVRRVAVAHYRNKRMTRQKAELWHAQAELERESISPARAVEDSERVALLASLLNELSLEKREVFVLSELEDLTAPEIAAAIEIPVNTVYSRLRLAREEMEAALSRYRARSRLPHPVPAQPFRYYAREAQVARAQSKGLLAGSTRA